MIASESGQSHSQRGEYWLEKHLAVIGKTKEDLAAELHARQLTAVAEVSLLFWMSAAKAAELTFSSLCSSATTRSRSTSSPTQNTSPVSTFTA